MPNPLEKKFEEKFDIYGDIFNEKRLPELVRILYEIPCYYLNNSLDKALNNDNESYSFIVRYIESKSFNAAVCDIEDGGLICIHASVPILLFQACILYASRCNIENALPLEKDGKIIVFNKKIKLLGKLTFTLTPNNEIIKTYEDIIKFIDLLEKSNEILQYGFFLYEIASRFMVMHESMHIILGHAGYLRNKLNMDVFFELSNERESKLDSGSNQALEFLADQNAAFGVLTQILQGNTLHEYGYMEPPNLAVSFRLFKLRAFNQSLCILFHMFPIRMEQKLSETRINSHPHPYVRMQWINTQMGFEIEEAEFHEAAVRPFAYSMASLSYNFITPNEWMAANNDNFSKQKNSFSDKMFVKIQKKAKKMQNKAWKYAPKFKGFYRGYNI
ncbi:hypothetical protein MNBD_GAMMA07-2732 [hydrothermal vent metagenome]|uniref:Uncharacterized protein n=1 Tax=hydrothermal vent metagenome TaxID=652676 RepID=A0A3B0WK45_9ZZZZ